MVLAALGWWVRNAVENGTREKLASDLESFDPQKVQQMLQTNIERIKLRFRTETKGKRRIQRLAGGAIHLVTERQVAGTRILDNQRLLSSGEFRIAS